MDKLCTRCSLQSYIYPVPTPLNQKRFFIVPIVRIIRIVQLRIVQYKIVFDSKGLEQDI